MSSLILKLIERRIMEINTEINENLGDIIEAKAAIMQKRKDERKLRRELVQLQNLLKKEQKDE